MLKADADSLQDAQFSVEEGERLDVHVFAADETHTLGAGLRDVLEVASVHFVPGSRPRVDDAAERAPKVLGVADADDRVKAVDADDVAVRVASLAVHDAAVVHAHFSVELRERFDAAEADVAVQRLGGHEGVFRPDEFERSSLPLLQLEDEQFARDEALYFLERGELHLVEGGVYEVADDVDAEGRFDGLRDELQRDRSVGGEHDAAYFLAADAVTALEHERGLGVELREVETAAVEADCPEVVADLAEVRKVHRRDGRVDGEHQGDVLELDGHVVFEEAEEALDRGDAHERHVCGAEDVHVALAAAREELVHQDDEVDVGVPGRLLPFGVEDAETASEDDARDVLHACVAARLERGEVQAVVLEVREAALDDFCEDVGCGALDDDVADAVANVDAPARVEHVLLVEDELPPGARLEERVPRARAHVREHVPVEVGLRCRVVVDGEDERFDCGCELGVAEFVVECKGCPRHITLFEDLVGEDVLAGQS